MYKMFSVESKNIEMRTFHKKIYVLIMNYKLWIIGNIFSSVLVKQANK